MRAQVRFPYPTSELRRAALLEFLYDRRPGYQPVMGFYGPSGRVAEMIADIDALGDEGAVKPTIGAPVLQEIQAAVTPAGRTQVEKLRQRRGDQALRQQACRSSLLGWLHNEGADSGPASALNWARSFMGTNPDSYYLGEPFSKKEIDQASGWLYARGLIGGETAVEEAAGPVYVFLTDQGADCVERYAGDSARYVKDRDNPIAAPSATFNIKATNAQIATGDYSQQTMSVGPSFDQIESVIDALFELLSQGRLDDDGEGSRLRDEAIQELGTSTPTGAPAHRFLTWAKDRLQIGANTAMVTVMTAAANGTLHDLEKITKVIG